MNHRQLKISGGLLAVLVVAYGGASWYAGRVAQQSIEAWVTQANQHIVDQWGGKGAAPALQIKSYDRGLFSSEIEYALVYHDEEGGIHELGVHDDLQHGPWPLAAIREGIWQPLAAYSRLTPVSGGEWKPWDAAIPQGQSPWVARTRISFTGDVSSEANFAPAKAEGMDFSGGTVQVHYEPKARQTTLSGHFDRFILQDSVSGATLKLNGLNLQARNRGEGDSDQQAHQQLDLDQLDFIPQDGLPLALQHQSLAVDTARTGGLMDSELVYKAQQLQLAARDLGELQMTATAQNVVAQAFQALMQTVAQVDAKHTPGSDLSAAEQQRLRDSLLPVLAASPRLALRTLRWSNPKGVTEIKAQADFRPVDGAGTPSDLGDTLQKGIHALSMNLVVSKPMLLQLVRQGQGGANGDVATALVSMMFDQYVGRLERVGLVKQSGQGSVQMDLGYADGQVTVNGVQMTPAQFGERLGALQAGLF
ncbi:MAG TPA: YdgA family protein [Castellaniella sp.]|uniref:YdgA family protein n=1 Tax=Castellaniella sp. TaxID=1955812 RepID=UPI002EECD19C